MPPEISQDEQDELYFLRMERAIEKGVRAGMDEHAKLVHAPLNDAIKKIEEDKVSLKTLAWAGAMGIGMVALLQFFGTIGH